MSFRTTAVVFGLVTALVAVLLVIALIDSGEEGTTSGEAGLVPALTSAGIKPSEIDTVEIVRTEPTEQKLVFVKVGENRWEAREPTTAKVDAFEIEQVVNDLFRAKPIPFPGLTNNLAVHGLDKPTLKVTLRKGADKSATVNVGLTTVGGGLGATFVTTSDAPNRPLAVRPSDLSALFRDSVRNKDGPAWQLAKWLPDYRVKKLLGADVRDPGTEVESVKVTTGGKELALSHPAAGGWKFDAPAGFGEADDLGDSSPRPNTAPFTGVRPLLNMLTSLQAGGPDDYVENPGDLSKYGLAPNDPHAIRVELKPKNGPAEVLFIGKPVEENGKPVVPAKVYCRLEGDPAVVKVQTDRVEALRQTVANPSELRSHDLIPPEKRDRIDAIDLTSGPNTVRLRKVAPGGATAAQWVLYGGPHDPTEAKAAEVTSLLTALARPRAAKDVLPAPNDAAFAGPEVKATVKVWVGGVEPPAKAEPGKLPPEPKLKGNPIELTFGKKEGDSVFVRRQSDGVKIDFKIAESVLPLVTTSRLDFIDPKLKSFDTQRATRLVFNRGAEPYDLEKRESPGGGWAFAKPDARKGKSADPDKVSRLLGLLSGLFAERVVSEAPTPDELKKWGLDPAAPRMHVTVTLKDDPEKERKYRFGNDTDDKQFVYAMQEGRPYAFLVRKSTFDLFATEDLRDPTVYRLDLSKVRRLKIRGWRGLVSENPLEYLLEKKGADWVAVSPPTPAGFAPDAGKVNALLTALAAPRAASFVGVGDKPEYGVDLKTNPDATEFTIESDGAPTVTLVLGKPAEGGKVYAASSAVPGEVFTLDAAAIRKLTEKPASLQK